MNALVLAAGLGTRLKPWTLKHPKALVPVGGVPMLERVLLRLREEGFDNIVVNVHHFARQIVDFIDAHDFGMNIRISDEYAELLDTGGAILRAAERCDLLSGPCLVHNVDILSDAPLRELACRHLESGKDISLVASERNSSRKLIFSDGGDLIGWHNVTTGEYKPSGFLMPLNAHESAFSGIYFVNPSVKGSLKKYSLEIGTEKFPVMDYFMSQAMKKDISIGELHLDSLHLIDIGKPATLQHANLELGIGN